MSALDTSTLGRSMTLARVAWAASRTRTTDPARREVATRHLARALSEARGLPLKVGQMLAGHDGKSPYQDVLDAVEPLPLSALQDTLEAALGAPIGHVFREISPVGIAASIGQVHRARLHDGTEVAVKVQYPGIGDALDLELSLVDALPALGPMRTFGFDVATYKRLLREGIEAELDYLQEAATQARFATETVVPGLVVPRVISALCRPMVLVQTWEEGVPLATARSWRREERRALGRTLMDTALTSLLRTGVMHADGNAGNHRARRGPRGPELVLLDYGATVQVSPARTEALRRLVRAARRGTLAQEGLGLLGQLGFDQTKLAEIADTLPTLLEALFEPFTHAGTFPIDDWNLSPRIQAALGEGRWWFRAAAPPDLHAWIRVLGGVVAELRTLAVDLDWSAAWDCVEGSLPPLVDTAAAAPVPLAPAAATPPDAARWLCIQVLVDGVQKVKVSLPARQVARLPELVPDHAHHHAAIAGIDLAALAARAVAGGLRPGELVDWSDASHRYHLWME